MINSMFRPLFLIFLLLFISISYSQERIVSGQVTTLKKIVLTNAEVKVLSSKKTVLTDSVGYFKVSCLPKDKIKISANGFISQKIKLDKKTNKVSINLKFKPSKKNLDVALGYGHIKEKDRSYAITSIRNDNNKFSKYSNMIDLIINSSPSITIKNGGIIIRGEGSLNGSNSALILVNGNQINMSQLSAFQPLDVESVDVLKGAGAAIYGTRGANGVILIKTKKVSN